MMPSFFPELSLATRVFKLVTRGYPDLAEKELLAAGFPDAEKQVRDVIGFVKLMKEKYGFTNVHRYK